MKRDYFRLGICSLQLLFIAAVVVGLLMLFSSCKTKRVVIEKPIITERVSHDTLYQTRDILRLDSVWLHDSIVVHGDCADRWHTVYKWKVDRQTDTVYRVRTDSIPKVVTVTQTKVKEVNATLSWWEKWKIGFGFLAVGFIVGALLVLIGLWKCGK